MPLALCVTDANSTCGVACGMSTIGDFGRVVGGALCAAGPVNCGDACAFWTGGAVGLGTGCTGRGASTGTGCSVVGCVGARCLGTADPVGVGTACAGAEWGAGVVLSKSPSMLGSLCPGKWYSP